MKITIKTSENKTYSFKEIGVRGGLYKCIESHAGRFLAINDRNVLFILKNTIEVAAPDWSGNKFIEVKEKISIEVDNTVQ